MPEQFQLIPAGTLIVEPDLNRVILIFPTQDDAIIFYEAISEWTSAKRESN